MAKTSKTAEYGDFQTPRGLSQAVCDLLWEMGLRPASVLEPTCGLGSLLFAALDRFPDVATALGTDINPQYISHADVILRQRSIASHVQLRQADFFQTDWSRILSGLPEPVLVVGNLPWVTNAGLSVLESSNVPQKSNFQGRTGLDALTGKSNFDISEWMLLRLLDGLQGRQGTIAMLCKSSVARKLLCHCWTHGIPLRHSAIHRIDAALHFGAAVDACLFITSTASDAGDLEAGVHSDLKQGEPESVVGWVDQLLVADKRFYLRWRHLRGEEILKWRSGVKHDCSKVMEFTRETTRFRNGFGELVDLEDMFLYPMLKSSDVAKAGVREVNRLMLVTQQSVGEDTSSIQSTAPRTWEYLQFHTDLLNRRGSAIYRNRPPYSVFGVGEYTFAPWKVAISGFYKQLGFTKLGPVNGKPVVLDDTSYFLPCRTEDHATMLASLLNSPIAQEFYRSLVFWDAKRPITADLLRQLDLRRLSKELGKGESFDSLFPPPPSKPRQERLLWPA